MKRTIILLLDSLGVGGADDAHKFKDIANDGIEFNDKGSNTLGNIALSCFSLKAEKGRSGALKIPNLNKLGIGISNKESTNEFYTKGLDENVIPIGAYGFAKEISTGKDTSSGHWEMMGYPVTFDWGYFSKKENSFPEELLNEIMQESKISGYLGNCHASGTDIIEKLGEEHIETNKPIFYTSADSVFQIAAHEESFGLDKLYELCEITAKILEKYNIARVIARPFDGNSSKNFARTSNRHDYAIKLPKHTVLDKMKDSKKEVVSVGKISDIFGKCGITKEYKASGLTNLCDVTIQAMEENEKDAIIFTNFVDFDANFGHRRDVSGYAKALEYFDNRLMEILDKLQKDDMLIITADHGCDPTWPGTNHTRENIPVLVYGHNIKEVNIGSRDTFADIGQTIASHHNLEPLDIGSSFYNEIKGNL